MPTWIKNYKLMKKYICLICAIALLPCLWANSDTADTESNKSEKPLGKTELRKLFKERVKNKQNGDFIIDLSEANEVEFPRGSKINSVQARFLSYVDKDLDVKELSKMIEKANSKKSAAKGMISVDAVFSSIAKYLAPKNMNLQKLSFSEGNIRQRIEDGLPVLCMVYASDEYKKIVPRSAERSESFSDIQQKKAWNSHLSKNILKIKEFDKQTISSGLLIGFNPDTGEYLVLGLEDEPFWMHAKEIKSVFFGAYSLRF